MKTFKSAFPGEKNIPVFFACNRNYLPVFSVAFQSLISCSHKEYTYDVWLLIADATEQEKHILLQMIQDHPNISLRFLNFAPFIPAETREKLFLSRYISLEAYFRIFIPEVFLCYKKYLWLDSDIIIKEDVAQLYFLDIKDKWVAMAPNVWTIYAAYEGAIRPEGMGLTFKEYLLNFLELKTMTHYCNDGILIMNAEQLRKNNFSELCLQALGRIKKPNYHDQDLINIVCEDHNYPLPLAWNHVWYIQEYEFLKEHLPQDVYEAYHNARQHPKIIHYAGSIKPWITPNKWLADDFWAEARKTPFYQTIILNNTIYKLGFYTKNKGPFNPDWQLIYQVLRLDSLKKLYLKYKLLSDWRFSKKWPVYKKYAQNIKETVRKTQEVLKKQ